MAIAKESYSNVGQFKIPLRKDTECPTIDYLDLDLAPKQLPNRSSVSDEGHLGAHNTDGVGSDLPTSQERSYGGGRPSRPFIATPTLAPGLSVRRITASAHGARLISGGTMGAASTSIVTTSFAAAKNALGLATTTTTATPVMPTATMAAMAKAFPAPTPEHSNENIWHQRLGYPNERTLQAARNIAETQVDFTISLTACDIYKINKGTKQPIRNKPGKTQITEELQLVSTDFLGSVTPAARENYRFMVKFSDHYTKFKAEYFILTKYKVLTTLITLVREFVKPLELCLHHLCADGGGKFITDFYRDCCKTSLIIQQLSSHNTPYYNGLSKRDGRTIMDVVRCMLNGAALLRSLWEKMAATAAFLLDCPPSKTIGGDTSYYRMFVEHINPFFM